MESPLQTVIYGLNFNGTEIPQGFKRKFAQRVRVTCSSCGGLGRLTHDTGHDSAEEPCEECHKRGKVWFELQGITNTTQGKQMMLIQADNGHRKLHVEQRTTAAGVWFGIYVY